MDFADYTPVCGTDKQTYWNKCHLESEACLAKSDVTMAYEGGYKCDFVCAMVWLPVCGSDGKTYGNECEMIVESCLREMDITVDHEGEC